MSLIDHRIITGNRAKVEDQDLDVHAEISKRALLQIETAGKAIAPRGAEYLGSATIHFYTLASKDSLARDFMLIEQLQLTKVEEGLADLGHKKLKDAMMRSYGRTPPRTRG